MNNWIYSRVNCGCGGSGSLHALTLASVDSCQSNKNRSHEEIITTDAERIGVDDTLKV